MGHSSWYEDQLNDKAAPFELMQPLFKGKLENIIVLQPRHPSWFPIRLMALNHLLRSDYGIRQY